MPLTNLKHSDLPLSLRGPTLIAAKKPSLRYWSTVWTALNNAHASDSTIRKHAYAIETFYLHVEKQYDVKLDQLIATGELDALRDFATSFLLHERNRAVSHNIDTSRSWKTVLRFLLDAVSDYSVGKNQKQDKEFRENIRSFSQKLKSLNPNPIRKPPHGNAPLF